MALTFDSFTLAAATADLREEPDARDYADCIEFRMDFAADPLDALNGYDGELPLLVTNRPEWEGGDASDAGRLDALATAIEHDAVGALDIELAALEDDGSGDTAAARRLLERANDTGLSVVVSTHDFESTPPEPELRDRLRRAAEYGDVAKIAVTARDRSDALSVLSVTHELTESENPVATMAMGEAGRHTRAVTPIYGSKIGYAPIDPARATAPGQYDLRTLAELVEQLSDSASSK